MRIVAFLMIVVSFAGGTLLYQYASRPQPAPSPRVSAPAAPTDKDLNSVIQDTALAAIRTQIPISESLRFTDMRINLFYADSKTHRAKWLVTGSVNSQPFGVTVLLDDGKFSVSSATISNADLGSTRTYQRTGQPELQRERRINDARIANEQRDIDKQKQLKSDILYQEQQQRKYEHQVEQRKAAQRATHYFGQ